MSRRHASLKLAMLVGLSVLRSIGNFVTFLPLPSAHSSMTGGWGSVNDLVSCVFGHEVCSYATLCVKERRVDTKHTGAALLALL